MQPTSIGTALLLLGITGVTSLAAQTAGQFEGKLTIKVGQGAETQLLSTLVKGDRALLTVPSPSGDVRLIIDGSAKSMTVLTSLGGQGIKLVVPVTPDTGSVKAARKAPTKLGTTQTVAGLKCQDYRMQDSTTACLTTSMGRFFLPSGNSLSGALGGIPGMRGGNTTAGITTASEWSNGLPDSLFPLKATDKDKKVVYEVTTATRMAVPESSFVVPADYADMTETLRNLQNMMRQGGGRRGGGL